jgi:osmotically-inducible protein OsmY
MSRTSEQLKRDVIEQLDWDDRIREDDIRVEFRNGAIHLSGTAHSFAARQAAEYDTWSVSGVLAVDNDLIVKPKEDELDDEHIATRVMHLLMWSPSIDANDISVVVNNGAVFLDGTVDTYWKKVRAKSIVSDVQGVVDIIDRIVVVPTHNIVDEAIAENIIQSLQRINRINVSDIDIEVDDGHVLVRGFVSDWNRFRAVEDIVYRAIGVKDVNNELRIQ